MAPSASILIVDDNAAVRTLLRFILEAQSYVVSDAASGDEALKILRQPGKQFELLITDVKMPGMDGRELVARLNATGNSVRVLYISGHCNLAAAASELYGAAFIAKPFAPADLLRAVEHALAATPQTIADPLE